MTVKEIFDLRKQGKIEEAYEAIRPMYAAHKGHYTSLCMFWTASDIFKKRLDEGRIDEARQIYQAMKRMLPYVPREKCRESSTPSLPWEKSETTADPAAAFIQYAARRLGKLKTDAAPEPLREETTPSNSSDSCSSKEISAISALSARDKDNSSDSCSSKEISAVSALSARDKDNPSARNKENPSARDKEQPVADEDYSGHLVVSLDEGVVRSDTDKASPKPQRLMEILQGEMSVREMMSAMELSSRDKFLKNHLTPALKAGLVEMTQPDSPKSPTQRYRKVVK